MNTIEFDVYPGMSMDAYPDILLIRTQGDEYVRELAIESKWIREETYEYYITVLVRDRGDREIKANFTTYTQWDSSFAKDEVYLVNSNANLMILLKLNKLGDEHKIREFKENLKAYLQGLHFIV